MQNAYLTLHSLGHAHSVEVWHEGHLAGGLFGVAIGGLFAAESMFHRLTDASKAALVFPRPAHSTVAATPCSTSSGPTPTPAAWRCDFPARNTWPA